MTTPNPRERLAIARPHSRARTPASSPRKRPSFDHAGMIREFGFPDGRPVAIHRHGVHFATPLKDDPAQATLAGVKGGAAPLPLRVPYPDFLAWWKGK